MDLRVDDSTLKSLMAKAIVDALTPEAREKLIRDAVTQTLMQPEPSSIRHGGVGRSPLQQAFDYAVIEQSRKFANEIIATDPAFNDQLRKLFADVAAKIFDANNRENMVDAIADTLIRAMTTR
jgi:hypothetical protein